MPSEKKPKNKKMLHDPLAWLLDEEQQEAEEQQESENDKAATGTDNQPSAQSSVPAEVIAEEGKDWGLFDSEEDKATDSTTEAVEGEDWGLFDSEEENNASDSSNEPVEGEDWGLFGNEEPKQQQDSETTLAENDEALLEEGGWGLFDEQKPLLDEEHDGWGLFGEEQQDTAENSKQPGWGLFKENITTDKGYIILPESLTISDVENYWKELEEEIMAQGDRLHVDASLVEYIDGAGVQLILVMEHYARALNKSFEVANPSEMVKNAVEMVGQRKDYD